MSDMKTPLDPYRPPQDSMSVPPGPPEGGGRPGALTAVCVIAIVLGALGLFGALISCGGLAFRGRMQQLVTMGGPPGAGDEAAEIQQMQDDIAAVQGKYLAFNVGFVAAHFVVAASLLAGGILTLAMRPAGRTVLVSVCGAAIVFELVRAVFQTIVQMETAAVMTPHFEELMAKGGGGGPSADLMVNAMRVGVFIGLALGIGFVLAKIVYYSISLVYLRKPHVKARFEGPRSITGLV